MEEFGLFQQKFRDLTASLGFTDAILLEHLLESMTTTETRKLIADCETTKEAWLRLERVYDDQEVAILELIDRLHDFSPLKGDDWVMVEEIATGL